MNSRGSDEPPLDGGEFLLQLLRKPSSSANPPQMPPHAYPNDPAVAAVGPSIPKFAHPNASYFSSNGYDLAYRAPPPLAQHNYFQHQSPNLNPNYQFPPGYTSNRGRIESDGADMGRLAFHRGSSADNAGRHQLDPNNIVFGSVNVSWGDIVGSTKQGLGVDRRENGFVDERERSSGFGTSDGDHGNYRRREGYNGHYRAPPGFGGKVTTIHENKDEGSGGNLNRSCWSTSQPVLRRAGEASVSNSNVEESVVVLNDEIDGLEEHLMGSLGLDDELAEKGGNKKFHRDKDYRSDTRGKWIMGQRMRNDKSQALCRRDITRHNGPFLALFESLIPAEEEKIKQKQLLALLEKLVTREWPEAHLHLYGSCANSFDFSKSDIDVCLAMELGDREKSDVLLRLADILQSENLQNVQALTRARVPIVKLKDPVTGISCDICINNVLAVVNTKLLRDYAQIDSRLRQLAFIVKHWAKSRGVNETYQGTLSSYAYVLMCIHFLQQRRPAILPCLQEMEATYYATVDNVGCAFYDEVEKLRNFGAQNRESIAELVWAFFHYWAYCHDYATDVISIRTGTTISKRAKDWTRRVGNDRHLICIEDPFEVSHDLGRVVDKFSIRVLREEFERAAKIMHHDPNPCVRLFEPYIPI